MHFQLPPSPAPHAVPISRFRAANVSGMTLIELLTVSALFVVMVSLVAPAIGIGSARSLDGAGNRVAGMLELARQNAMTRSTLTALVVAVDGNDRYRAFTILEAAPRDDGTPLSASDWRQVNRWETLPEGISADADPFGVTAGSGAPPLPSLRYQGSDLPSSALRHVTFLPNGRVMNASMPSTIRLVEGFWDGGSSPTYTRSVDASDPANFYEILVLPSTGRLKVHRP